MSQIVPYLFESREVRVVLDERGEPWFVAADVCSALGIGDVQQAVERLEDDERGGRVVPTPGGKQEMRAVSEAGVYRLVVERNHGLGRTRT